MTTRRSLLKKASAVGLAGAILAPFAAIVGKAAGVESAAHANRLPGVVRRRPRIKKVIRRDETLLHRLGGYGGTTCMTWGEDDRQFLSVCEGWDWPGLAKSYVFQSYLMTAAGGPQRPTFQAVPHYPTGIPMSAGWKLHREYPYYANNVIAVANHIYQYVSTSDDVANDIDGPGGWRGAKLIHSPDNGDTWFNQDGTSPVRWQSIKDVSRKSTIFWKEPRDVFSDITLLQMGKAYRDNRDGYVYGYSHCSGLYGRGGPSDLCVFRSPKDRLLERSSYEFYAGIAPNDKAVWTKDIEAVVATHSFPAGWHCWSVVYNAPLGLYMMAANQLKLSIVPDQERFPPSSLGLWVATDPWGPWDQVYEEAMWTPGHNPASRPTLPIIAPKWISRDGKSFWLVWSDWVNTSAWRDSLYREIFYAKSEDEYYKKQLDYFNCHPYDGLNTQRIDLEVA